LDAPLPQRQPVQIWSGGRALTVHGVVVRGDSVRAVPRWKSPTCDTCAILYSRRAIDSVKVKVFSPVRTGLLVSFLLALGVLAISMSQVPWMS